MEGSDRSPVPQTSDSLQPWSRRRLVAVAIAIGLGFSALVTVVVATWPLLDLDYRHLWTAQFSMTNLILTSVLGGMVVKQQSKSERNEVLMMLGIIFGLVAIVLVGLVSFILALQYHAKHPEYTGKTAILVAGAFSGLILGFGYCAANRERVKTLPDVCTVAGFIFAVVTVFAGILTAFM